MVPGVGWNLVLSYDLMGVSQLRMELGGGSRARLARTNRWKCSWWEND